MMRYKEIENLFQQAPRAISVTGPGEHHGLRSHVWLMDPNLAEFLKILAYIGMVVGVIGVVLPLIPGPILIWASAFLWAWADGFQAMGWPTLLGLAGLALLAEVSDMVLAAMGARRGGASWFSMLVAAAAALVGFLFLNLLGALIGGFLGLLAWETYRHGGEVRQAWRASSGFILGYVAAMVVKMGFALVMVIIVLWQIWR